MPLALQSRVLKVLQEKQSATSGSKVGGIDVRILASSSGKLDHALAEKRLNADLYYRLSSFTVNVPPLRQRREEIKILLRYSMHKVARYYGLSPREFSESALDACQNHSWPGNLKELETFVKRYLIAGDEELALSELGANSENEAEPLPEPPMATSREELEAVDGAAIPKSLKSMIQSVRWETERNAIASALEKTAWNRKAAARLLGVSYRTILYKIEQYEMRAPESILPSVPGARLSFPTQNKGNGKAS